MARTERSRRGPLLHNPGLLDREELIATFLVRLELLDELREQLKRQAGATGLQHLLLIGSRGMGKTTLLLRLAYAIDEEPELKSRWRALPLTEEQYAIGDLADLWLEVLHALAAEDRDQQLSRQVEDLRDQGLTAEALEKDAYGLVVGWCQRQGRQLALMVDNLNMILHGLEDQQQHRLRKLLMQDSYVLLIGAAPSYFSEVSHQDRPLYDFFRRYPLDPLRLEELEHLLCALAQAFRNERAAAVLAQQPQRVRQIHRLTGGNPRIALLIYGLLSESPTGQSRHDLESLLDEVTPFYKHQIEALKGTQQRLLHAIARHWHPIPQAALAAAVRGTEEAYNDDLQWLIDQGYVEAVELGPGRGYQVVERLYNIYYLMRFSRPGRQDLRWLVSFMEAFYDPQQFPDILTRSLEGLAGLSERQRIELAEYARSILDHVPDREVQLSAAVTLLKDGGSVVRPVVAEVVEAWLQQAERLQGAQPDAARQQRLNAVRISMQLGNWPLADAACQQALGQDPASPGWHFLAGLVRVPQQDLAGAARHFAAAEELFQRAGEPFTRPARVAYLLCSGRDDEGYVEAMAALPLFPDRYIQFALLWVLVEAQLRQGLLAASEMNIEKMLSLCQEPELAEFSGLLIDFYLRLGRGYRAQKDFESSIRASEHGLRVQPTHWLLWEQKGESLCQLKRFAEAAATYEHATILAPDENILWLGLAVALLEMSSQLVAPNLRITEECFDKKLPTIVKFLTDRKYTQALREITKTDNLLLKWSVSEVSALRDRARQAFERCPKSIGADLRGDRVLSFIYPESLVNLDRLIRRQRVLNFLFRFEVFRNRLQWNRAGWAMRQSLKLTTADLLTDDSLSDAYLAMIIALAGHEGASAAKALLDDYPDLNPAQRWLPLYAALEYASGADPGRLTRLAPEVRTVAEDVLARIAPSSPDRPRLTRPAARRGS